MADRERVHATAIAVDGKAALIVGPSGSGKSDLALRCLGLLPSQLVASAPLLVADDQVQLERAHGRLMASPPATIAGMIEVRGVGILRLPFQPVAEVRLVADLMAIGHGERHPDPVPTRRLLGFDAPVVHLAPFEASAPLKLIFALQQSPTLNTAKSGGHI